MAAAQLLPIASAKMVTRSLNSRRKVTVSKAINAAQARNSTMLLVSMMISVCLRRRDMFRKPSMNSSICFAFNDCSETEKPGANLNASQVGGCEIYFECNVLILARQINYPPSLKKIVTLANGQNAGVL